MKKAMRFFVVFALLLGAKVEAAEIRPLSLNYSSLPTSISWQLESDPPRMEGGGWFFFAVGAVVHDVSHEMSHKNIAEEGKYPFSCGPFYGYERKTCMGDGREDPRLKKKFYAAGPMSSVFLTEKMIESGRRDPLAMGIIVRGVVDQIVYPAVSLLTGGYGDYGSLEKAGGSKRFSCLVLGTGLFRAGTLLTGRDPLKRLGFSMGFDPGAGVLWGNLTHKF